MNKRLEQLLNKELLTLDEEEEIAEMEEVKEVNIVSGMCDKYKDAVWYECILQNGSNYNFYVKDEEE